MSDISLEKYSCFRLCLRTWALLGLALYLNFTFYVMYKTLLISFALTNWSSQLAYLKTHVEWSITFTLLQKAEFHNTLAIRAACKSKR